MMMMTVIIIIIIMYDFEHTFRVITPLVIFRVIMSIGSVGICLISTQ
jgi:hypothetical protein